MAFIIIDLEFNNLSGIHMSKVTQINHPLILHKLAFIRSKDTGSKYFRDLAVSCRCPKEFPVCVCGEKAKVKIISRKAIEPTKEEVEINL